tara:strand:+ start:745 stop:1083 length:339 start_codon:yes stop_codon:yes gene_type:complete
MLNTAENITGAAATGLLLVGSSVIDVSDPIVVATGGAAVAALTGAIKVLWDKNNKLSAATDIALTKCEDEHKKASANMDLLVQQVISLTGEVGEMRGRIKGYHEALDETKNQ